MPGSRPHVGAERLDEEAAVVAVDGRLEQEHAVEAGRKRAHRAGSVEGSRRAGSRRSGVETIAAHEASRDHHARCRPPRRTTATRRCPHYITARFDEFSRSQKDVAQYIVDHLDEAAFQTAEELARRANTSSSTVVRFSQALGFEGFPELQQAAREEYRRRRAEAATAVVAAAAPLFSLDQTEFETALATDHVNVEETARKLSRRDIEARGRGDRLRERVLIAGTDQMAFFASYLRHLLMLLDIRAEVVASPSQEALGAPRAHRREHARRSASPPAARTR